jgi:hypothetical protein
MILGNRTPVSSAGKGTSASQGTRASANTSGPDFTWAFGPVKLRTKIRTERRKLASSAGPVFRKSELFGSTIQPFDLMSRRHPLSSTRAAGLKFALTANCLEGSCDVAGVKPPAFFSSEITSSWRPCGSSSQSSSLRSSLSSLSSPS